MKTFPLLSAVVVAFSVALSPAFATQQLLTLLDGQTFSGKIGHSGSKETYDDELAFKGGAFTSTACQQADGFAPGTYKAERKSKSTTFEADLANDKGGKMHWTGEVRNGKVTATALQTNADGTTEKVWYKGRVRK